MLKLKVILLATAVVATTVVLATIQPAVSSEWEGLKLRAQFTTFEMEIQRLKSALEKQTKLNDDLEKRVTYLSMDVSTLRSDNSSLEKQVHTLEEALKIQGWTVDSQQANLKDIKRQLRDLQMFIIMEPEVPPKRTHRTLPR